MVVNKSVYIDTVYRTKKLIITDLGEAPESLPKRLTSANSATSSHDDGIR